MVHEASFNDPDENGTVGDDRGVVQHVRSIKDIVQLLLGEIDTTGEYGYPVSLRLYEPIVQIATLTPALVEIGDVFNILYDGVIFATFTAVAGTVANVTAGLVAAWDAAVIVWEAANTADKGPARIAATDSTTHVTLTFNTEGVPFAQRITTSVVDGGGNDTQTLTLAVTQNNDTSYVEESSTHILGTKALKFDKIDGSNNKVNAGVQLSNLNLDVRRLGAEGFVDAFFLLSSKVNIVGVHVNIGTDESNYAHWDLLEAAITAAVWQEHEAEIKDMEPTVVGAGWNPALIKYVAVYVEFDLATRTLADILVDHVSVHN